MISHMMGLRTHVLNDFVLVANVLWIFLDQVRLYRNSKGVMGKGRTRSKGTTYLNAAQAADAAMYVMPEGSAGPW